LGAADWATGHMGAGTNGRRRFGAGRFGAYLSVINSHDYNLPSTCKYDTKQTCVQKFGIRTQTTMWSEVYFP